MYQLKSNLNKGNVFLQFLKKQIFPPLVKSSYHGRENIVLQPILLYNDYCKHDDKDQTSNYKIHYFKLIIVFPCQTLVIGV